MAAPWRCGCSTLTHVHPKTCFSRLGLYSKASGSLAWSPGEVSKSFWGPTGRSCRWALQSQTCTRHLGEAQLSEGLVCSERASLGTQENLVESATKSYLPIYKYINLVCVYMYIYIYVHMYEVCVYIYIYLFFEGLTKKTDSFGPTIGAHKHKMLPMLVSRIPYLSVWALNQKVGSLL